MLTEFKGVRQREEEGIRRWFFDDYFDLIIWYDNNHQIEGFQLCYDKNYNLTTSPPASNCLIAYGNENKESLKKIGIEGFYFEINNGRTTAIIQNVCHKEK